ncbi:MAG: serine O-acetyltransferase [Deltaproteobacteria bacterium]|nr:serine O-acetyltransferase [Deltaproteobacteria bacterium]
MFLQEVREDIRAVFERDPAARSAWEVVFAYPGFHAVLCHRLAHWLWERGFTTIARVVSNISRFFTGIEIHPGARIGRRVFIDHGTGVVIGETAEVGNDVTLYQGVSLAGTSTERGKRHPTIEDWVLVGAGAKVLGPITVGRHSRIGAGSVVVQFVPPHSTVVGIPGKVVKESGRHQPSGKPVIDLDHADLPDPVSRALSALLNHVEKLEQRLDEVTSRQGSLENRFAEGDEELQRVRMFLKNGTHDVSPNE